jgi:hypothetical protein
MIASSSLASAIWHSAMAAVTPTEPRRMAARRIPAGFIFLSDLVEDLGYPPDDTGRRVRVRIIA